MSAMPTVNAASTRNAPRQPIHAASAAIGAVASRLPNWLMPNSVPVTVAKWRRSNQRAQAMIDAIKTTAVPRPTSTRPNVSHATECAIAKTTAPTNATNSIAGIMRRGP